MEATVEVEGAVEATVEVEGAEGGDDGVVAAAAAAVAAVFGVKWRSEAGEERAGGLTVTGEERTEESAWFSISSDLFSLQHRTPHRSAAQREKA